MSATDVKFSEYSIHTLPQLHYFIEHESHSLTGKFYTKTSWNVIKSVEIDGVKFMLVETKWWAFVSHLFLNRGYRILADRQCTPNTDQLIILFEEESCAIGKQNALQQWEQKIEAVLDRHNITGNFKSIGNRKWGYYQEPTAVITGPKSLEGQPIAATVEFYQTILYGTVREKGLDQSPKNFYRINADTTLHVGIAQCAIPSKRFLSRVESDTNGDFMKLLPLRISYINEMDIPEFKSYIVKNDVNQCYTSYLRYLRNSIDSLVDSMYTEENRTAIREALVNDLFDKYTKSSDNEEVQAIEKERLKLNLREKTYFDLLNVFKNKLQTPPKNQNQDILLYIHGIDNTVEDALLSASQIACDIGFAGRLAIFSWPSLGGVKSYIKDSMHQIDIAIPGFHEFLFMLCKNVRKIHIIAHSKGALLFSKSFT